jgi:hypothetical protein
MTNKASMNVSENLQLRICSKISLLIISQSIENLLNGKGARGQGGYFRFAILPFCPFAT